MEERIYTVNLTDAYETLRTKRAIRAVKVLRKFLVRHTKTDDVLLSPAVNDCIWAHSMQKPPRKIKVRVVKEGEVAKAYLIDEKIPAKETKKETPKESAPKEDKKEAPKEQKKEAPATHAKEAKKEERAAEKKEHPKEAKK